MISKRHYFFLLKENSLPILGSLNSYSFLLSSLIFLKFNDFIYFFFRVINVIFVCIFWWFTYSTEFNLLGLTSRNLEKGIKFSMILFISSEILFFFSFFWAYFRFSLSPNFDLGLSWPPLHLIVFDFVDVPLLNRIILLSSGIRITISHHYLIKGLKGSFLFFLAFTISLGWIFSLFQILEYNSSFFCLRDSVFGSCFFLLTGFHGLHVMIGSFFLFYVFVFSVSTWVKIDDLLRFELSRWYWHFVDVVWIFLYFSLYVYGGF